MIKADGEEFELNGTIIEILQEFAGICVSLINEGVDEDILIKIVNRSKSSYTKYKEEIIDLKE